MQKPNKLLVDITKSLIDMRWNCGGNHWQKTLYICNFFWLARFSHKSFAKAGRVLNEIYEIILQDECFCHIVAAAKSQGTQPNFF